MHATPFNPYTHRDREKNSLSISTFCIGLFCLGLLTLLSGCRDEPPEHILRVYLSSDNAAYAKKTRSFQLPVSEQEVQVTKEPLFMEGDIIEVDLAQVKMGKGILLHMDSAATRQLYRTSVASNGGKLILTINGKAIGYRPLKGAIQSGKLFMFVEMRDKKLESMIPNLKESVRRVQEMKNK